MTASTVSVEAPSAYLDPFWLLALAGVLFTVVGAFELGTQLFPLALGSPEWEFGTYCSLMDTFPQLLLGLGLLSVYATAQSKRPLALTLAIVFFLLTIFVLFSAFFFATNVPQVLRINPRSNLQTGIKKAVLKASLQSVVYPIAFLWLGIFLVRNSSRSRH